MSKANLVKVYGNLIKGSKPSEVNHSIRMLAGERVPMETAIIGPSTRFNANMLFQYSFIPDEKGMCEMLQKLENAFGTNSEGPIDLLTLLYFMRNMINEYFGGLPHDMQDRENAYSQAVDQTLMLSDMKGKGLGACAEYATVAHNCFVVLQEAGLAKSYSSRLTSGRMLDAYGEGRHSFIVLSNNDSQKDSLIFDVANDIYDERKKTSAVGVFVLSPEELERFRMGETIDPINIYKKLGYDIDSGMRRYGSGFDNLLEIKPQDIVSASEQVDTFSKQVQADISPKQADTRSDITHN